MPAVRVALRIIDDETGAEILSLDRSVELDELVVSPAVERADSVVAVQVPGASEISTLEFLAVTTDSDGLVIKPEDIRLNRRGLFLMVGGSVSTGNLAETIYNPGDASTATLRVITGGT